MNTSELYKWMTGKIADYIIAYANHNNIEFSKGAANAYYNETAAVKLSGIVADVRAQQKEVDDSIFGGSKAFSKKAFEINLTHALVEYAKEIVDHSVVAV